jgi:hypothetical protein
LCWTRVASSLTFNRSLKRIGKDWAKTPKEIPELAKFKKLYAVPISYF